jgi:hypothetical protein
MKRFQGTAMRAIDLSHSKTLYGVIQGEPKNRTFEFFGEQFSIFCSKISWKYRWFLKKVPFLWNTHIYFQKIKTNKQKKRKIPYKFYYAEALLTILAAMLATFRNCSIAYPQPVK